MGGELVDELVGEATDELGDEDADVDLDGVVDEADEFADENENEEDESELGVEVPESLQLLVGAAIELFVLIAVNVDNNCSMLFISPNIQTDSSV